MYHIESYERKNHEAGCATESSPKSPFHRKTPLQLHFSKFTTLFRLDTAHRVAFQRRQHVPLLTLDTFTKRKRVKSHYIQ